MSSIPEPDSEAEFSKLIEKWQQDHQNPNYDVIPFLTSCSKLLESEMTEFHKLDPDPFDQRHPMYVLPECKFSSLLSRFEDCSELREKIVSTYLKTTQSPKNVEATVIAAARLALAADNGYSLKGLDTDEWMRIFISWIIEADEPLRTYATGLLDGKHSVQRATNEENDRLLSTLLKRLWNYIEPNKYAEPECVVHADRQGDVAPTMKRKRLSDSNRPSPKIPRVETPKMKSEDNNINETVYESDISNSSWAEQMPVILGSDYSLETPLSECVRQCCIFDLIKCYGEFQDFLSLFLRWNVLELINKYLKNRCEGPLTFKVLEFLSSLLCHNKLAMNFVELDGIRNILQIPRPSMGSTGVALCLYNIAYKKEVMEKICQPTSKILQEVITYAIWLLECSHESGRSHMASFFSMTLSHRNVLNLFDASNGVRCLINMISTAKPIAASNDDTYDPLEDSDLQYVIAQIIKPVCVTLRRYFEAHIIFRVSQAVRLDPNLKEKYASLERMIQYEPSSHGREEYFEYFEMLRTLAERNSSFNLDSWSPIALFYRLDGIPLMLKVVNMSYELDAVKSQVEVARAALDVLCVVTLYRPCQLVLTRRHPNLGIEDTGLFVLISFILSDEVQFDEQPPDSVAMNSAIAVLANCTESIYCKGDDDSEIVKPCINSKQKKKRSIRDKLCKLIQQNDGIALLLKLLKTTEPAQTADETRYLTCKALVGLSDYKPARQILSKLQEFVSGKLFAAIKEPVLEDKKHLHEKLCESMEILLKKVTGKAISLDGDLKTAQRSNIVSETRVQFNNKDVLSMIHSHLLWSGLHNAAETLAQETGIAAYQDELQFATPKVKRTAKPIQIAGIDGGGDHTPRQSKIAFSRGDRAFANTPTSSNINTPFMQRRAARTDTVTPMSQSKRKHDRFTLSSSGFVTVDPRHSRRSPSPITLNSIIEEYFQHQHSKCRNPVVTVPQFSLFTPHRCPEPRNNIGASINATRRLQIRQGICPKWGGTGGMKCDLRLIYNKFKPAGTIKCMEERKVHFTSVAFLPGEDRKLILGDAGGNIQIPGPYSFEERTIHGISHSAISHLEPSNLGDVMLTLSPTFWSSKCSLLALNDQLEQKLDFDDVDHVEFSKAVQDKILGTRESKAIVFDANTGTILGIHDKEELACNYKNNCATYSYDDKLILSDGLLWDARKSQTQPLHKFDKFNPTVSGVFHPNGIEVIINTEVWDVRTFGLLRTVPAFDQSFLMFNRSRSVIYATKMGYYQDDDVSKMCKGLSPSFQTYDSASYDQLGFITLKQQIYALALDKWDRNIAVIETPGIDDGSASVCRLYEVGLTRDDNEEEEDETAGSGYEDGSSVVDNESAFHPDGDEFSLGEDTSLDSLSDIGSDSSFDGPAVDSAGDSDWESTDED